MAVLVTGGAGYIGSHTCVELLQKGYELILLDNFRNSEAEVINQIRLLTDREFTFYKVDLLNRPALEKIFKEHNIEAVIHLAALKSVSESMAKPLNYYTVNLTGTLNLLHAMKENEVKKLVFSSTAAVYGQAAAMPVKEDASLEAVNPYGRTKQMIEQVLYDLSAADPEWGISLLRYFNPVGAHPSGAIGEKPAGTPANLMPYVTQVASGQLAELFVFGNDYKTADGTGVRDYIHVTDLAEGHLRAMDWTMNTGGIDSFNLGTGRGYSVLEVIRTFEQVTGEKVPFKVAERRPGDVAESFADVSKAAEVLNWKAEKGLEEMCRDAWRWQQKQAETNNG